MGIQCNIGILIVDDSEVARGGIRALIAEESDMQTIGEARDGMDALEAFRMLSPEIVLMDIAMPRMDGWEATRLILKEFPTARILVLSNHDEQEYVNKAITLGAVGFIGKDRSVSDLRPAIRAVACGWRWFGSQSGILHARNDADA